MFETSSVSRARQKFHPATFIVSVTLHGIAIAVVVFVTIWEVEVPAKAPDQVVIFRAAAGPPPPPMISKGSREAERETTVPKATEDRAPVDAAPVAIPDLVAPLDTEIGTAESDGGTDEAFGDPSGAVGGDPGGEIFGSERGNGSERGVPEPTYEPGNGVRAPVIVQRVEPLYPPLLQRIGRAGEVRLQCVISKSGALTDIRVIHSTHPLFAESAIAAVKEWKFLPGRLEGRAVATRFDFTVRFNVQR